MQDWIHKTNTRSLSSDKEKTKQEPTLSQQRLKGRYMKHLTSLYNSNRERYKTFGAIPDLKETPVHERKSNILQQ